MVVALPGSESTPKPRLVADKYQLIRPLGHGGMGSVWQAEHLTLHSPVAIKLLDPAIAGDAQNLQRFLLEARAAAALRSPHVVQILDHGVDEGTPYIVMEQLEGELLAERLERCKKLSPRDTARIVTHIARALARAHAAGIVHRDLKPSNVFLVDDDDEELAKLFDFGIAKSLYGTADPPQSATVPGMLVGTPYYMSPEQAQGAPTLDHRTDIWALGVIAFECLLGRRPFEASTLASLLIGIREAPRPIPSQLNAVPSGFDAWFARACARNANQRFESAKEAADELRRICEHEGPQPAPANDAQRTLVSLAHVTSAVRAIPRTLRSPLALVLGCSALALCAAALGAWASNRIGSAQQVAPATNVPAAQLVATASAARASAAESTSAPATPVVSLAPSAPSAPSAPPSSSLATPTKGSPSLAIVKRRAPPHATAPSPTFTPAASRSTLRSGSPSPSARSGVDLGI